MGLELPQTLLGWLGVITALALGMAFFVYQLRQNALKLLRDSITDLTKRVEYLEKENTRLYSAYKDVKFKKDYLKQIVLQALSQKSSIENTLGKEIREHIDK